jgi:8-oxo-dGTP pyrophosphatase MutT (NUDIX family)
MTGLLRTAWDDYIAPMFQRPRRLQAAALCYRGTGDDKEVLLITSRDTGRWILPKGWLMRGLDAREAAMREAWEEAGVARGYGDAAPIGSYSYDKRLDDGLSLPVETLVFTVAVETIKDEFPEASERQRKWVSVSDAANLVDEPGLKSILRNLH